MLFEQIFNKTFILFERFFEYKHFYVIIFFRTFMLFKTKKTYLIFPQHKHLFKIKLKKTQDKKENRK